jgi:isopenicillin N synthase-like dioxygenase
VISAKGGTAFAVAEVGKTTAGQGGALALIEQALREGGLEREQIDCIAIGLGLTPTWFEEHMTADPTALFRIFHYPPGDDSNWGVAEHTDYGLLTLLAQDDRGGLQVHSPHGWIDVPAEPDVLVCNIGDMLDRLTVGRYRSTPHRVRNLSGKSRLSFPFFFDPSWDAEVVPLPLDGSPPSDDAERRWDASSVRLWEGTYGDYLTGKVAKVFPELFARLDATR